MIKDVDIRFQVNISLTKCAVASFTGQAVKYKIAKSFYCKDHEYCCGTGCCTRIYKAWYFWFGLSFTVLICCLFGGLKKIKKKWFKSKIQPSQKNNPKITNLQKQKIKNDHIEITTMSTLSVVNVEEEVFERFDTLGHDDISSNHDSKSSSNAV